jgi:hypothetical protein
VTRAFESHEVHPGFVYYTSGPDDFPNAIIGNDEKMDPRHGHMEEKGIFPRKP